MKTSWVHVALAAVSFGPQIIATATFNGLELPWPTRDLEWKDVNVLSISDSHGWLLGHQHSTWPEPNYSGDYGALASFITHMRAIAREKGVDLLVVDAGDHHDGSGLVSSSKDGATKTDEIFSMIHFDVLAIGNHELYEYGPAKEVYDHQDRYHGRYITSNTNITVEKDGEWVSKPIGERYVKFRTETGRQVTAFGVIFNSQGANLTIQPPSAMVKEQWFLEAIESPPDYFLLVGHMPVRNDPSAQWHSVFKAIRKKHPHIPILIFGGHDHTRDCRQYDDHSIAVVPGRYLETVAFTSTSLPDAKDPSLPLNLARRFIDANRHSYMYHTRTTPETFDTTLGHRISTYLLDLASSLNISDSLGTAPHDLFLSRVPAGHPNHVNTVWTEQVIPTVLRDPKRIGKKVVMMNAGSLRFDLFRGEFNRNDELTISPFASAFAYTRMKAGLARQITLQMNLNGATKFAPFSMDTIGRTVKEEDQRVERIYRKNLRDQWVEFEMRSASGPLKLSEQMPFSSAVSKGLTMGYVTRDSCPGIGDDVEHIPVPYSNAQVDFIQSPFPDAHDDELVDVVVMDFTLDDFFIAVKMLDPLSNLGFEDMKPYAEGISVNVMWGLYASQAWQG
ncbi:vacuolar protein [Kockovaella imperatae]|uniref:Vacuolar protein n=1 Tax=Kockovaella imperatae TaxID=4999 RepID=A0A1Y1UIF0_9TREE|nr:vacuolar protein [Kockovaella imperatae]ORX37264.1 vacuolar protein [Kockovaella imperatae]